MADADEFARQLAAAHAALPGSQGPGSVRQVSVPDRLSGCEVAFAYEVQRATLDLLDAWWGPAMRVGYKVGLTAADAQRGYGASRPIFGRLTERNVLPNEAVIELAAVRDALVEVELVLRTVAEVSPRASDFELAAAVSVAAAFEVPTSRLHAWHGAGKSARVTASAAVADNAFAGYLVLGDTWLPGADLPLDKINVRLSADKGPTEHGHSSAVLGNPLRSLAWLAGELVDLGETLPIGSIVATGAILPARPATRARLSAEFSHGLGTVRMQFA